MKPGETKRFRCGGCSTEVEICLEPKSKGVPVKAPSKFVSYCPFCESDDITEVTHDDVEGDEAG